MGLYALLERNIVIQLTESEQGVPVPPTPYVYWVPVPDGGAVQLGWRATFNEVWTFAPSTEQELRDAAALRKWELLNAASAWLQLNSLQFRVDLATASPQEQALLVAYKQYCVDVSDIDKQAGYPAIINWPVAPF